MREGGCFVENAQLVGLSRQVALRRELDVVANNVANINTTGFKADRSLFEEYLRSPAHEDNFHRADRRVSFVHDRATFHDFAAGPSEQTKNPLDIAIDGNAFLVVQTAAGERYTRDGGLQINNQGQLVTASGDAVLGTSGPIVFQPTDSSLLTPLVRLVKNWNAVERFLFSVVNAFDVRRMPVFCWLTFVLNVEPCVREKASDSAVL